MSDLFNLIALTLLAGLAMPLGALGASVERIRPLWLEQEFRHSVLAFGGGTLLSAVTLVLVPQGMAHLSPVWVAVFLVLGGFAFLALDRALSRRDTPASMLMLMLADFVPESIALGAVFALDSGQALLLAVLIALQNLPEGFNAYRELRGKAQLGRNKIIALFALAALLGPVAGLTGYQWLSSYPQGMSAIMLLASGGILYSVFQDLAPQVKMRKRWGPPMGAIFGFAAGLVGQMVLRR